MIKIKEMMLYGNFKKRIIFIFVETTITAVVFSIVNQYLSYSIFDNAIAKENLQAIVFISILFMVKRVLTMIEGIFHCLVRHHLQRDFSNFARKDIYKDVINSKISFFDRSNSGELFELVVNDSRKYSMVFTQVGQTCYANIIRIVTLIVILLFINIKLTAIMLVCYFIGYLAVAISNKKIVELFKKLRKVNIVINRWITEQIDGFELINSVNMQSKRLKEVDDLLNSYNKEAKYLERVVRQYNFVYIFFSTLVTIIVLTVGSIDMYQGILSYGTLMIFIGSNTNIKDRCDTLVEKIQKWVEAIVSFQKILDFKKNIELEEEIGTEIIDKIDSIEFKNVNFSYDDSKQVLKDISLNIGKNEKIALIGKTGCGKTTIANLLCRFYNKNSGDIYINKLAYENFSLTSIRNSIGYVMQDTVIFDKNIYDNINYAKKSVSKERIIEICKQLNLHDKILSFKDGYDTNLYDNKELLSEGERQMINFARIMVEDPSVIILDEVTSSLSYENEELIKNAIDKVIKNKICLIIAHRLSTIKSCDKIVYLDEGEIKEMGTHHELIDQKGYYYKLINYKKQKVSNLI